MNPFLPENLSPLPSGLLPCALPYGLTWEDLLPILPGFDRLHRDRAQAFASHQKQGLNGGENSIILTLRYPVMDHIQRSLTVFIKSQPDRQKWEAERYRFLAANGVPVAQLLAALYKEDNEVIILEFLPKIGIDFQSETEIDALLKLSAQINSLPVVPGMFNTQPGMPQEQFDQNVIDALDSLKQRAGFEYVDVPRWFAAYQEARRVVESMPVAVNHDQFSYQQVGWAVRGEQRSRNKSQHETDMGTWQKIWSSHHAISLVRGAKLVFLVRKAPNIGKIRATHARYSGVSSTTVSFAPQTSLVVFDLETLGLRPRFVDIASILYSLAHYSGRAEEDLFQRYLAHLHQVSGAGFLFAEALQELRWQRIRDIIESIPWLVGWTASEPDARDAADSLWMAATCLRDDLTALGLI